MIISSVLFCLLSFSNSFAEFDSSTNKTLEKRLHSIYVSHYARPVIDSDWFKILESIEVQKHTVQAGDTLWGISRVYFGDGNYWSKLWSVNKSITNPHLIFVGDVIKFRTGTFDNPPGIEI
ncbi:MAG: LysM peptidoglycan-binding domain-containing protein, partial [Bdellovibrionaceae bacterium]|nr:LysM peptidoglycan-binding domain-containing protein [Pseudobdellovibrionaceae bacterium]